MEKSHGVACEAPLPRHHRVGVIRYDCARANRLLAYKPLGVHSRGGRKRTSLRLHTAELPPAVAHRLQTATAVNPPPLCVTFRLVVAPLRGPGQSPVLPFACCVGSPLSVGRCSRCSCRCRFRVRGAQWLVCWGCDGCGRMCRLRVSGVQCPLCGTTYRVPVRRTRQVPPPSPVKLAASQRDPRPK